MAYAVGPISGCHINPAVTSRLLVARRITSPDAVRYWSAQVVGAVVAAGMLLATVAAREGGYESDAEGLGTNGYGAHSPGAFPWGAALAAEVIVTALLVFTVLAATDRIAGAAFAGIPIGLVLTLIHPVSIPITNRASSTGRRPDATGGGEGPRA